ncbi:MAG TPA: ABC transporter substrate-binding protein [Candidatus Methylomirabilis sp.]|nr:ABC transporter substrate-binding protein [Candidatus Methylomirabilis sp.]
MKAGSVTRMVVTLLSLLLVPSGAVAGSPTDWIRTTLGDVRDTVAENGADAKISRETLTEMSRLIDERFDFPELARLALGQHWHQRSPQERKEFVTLFGKLLARSHFMKLSTKVKAEQRYLGERIEGDRAIVQAVVMAEENEIPIDYALVRYNGAWKIYDLGIDGTLLSEIYRSQFNRVISSGSYDELIRRMQIKLQEFAVEAEAEK